MNLLMAALLAGWKLDGKPFLIGHTWYSALVRPERGAIGLVPPEWRAEQTYRQILGLL